MAGLGLSLIAVALLIMVVRAYPLQLAALAIGAVVLLVFVRNQSERQLQRNRERAERCADRQLEKHRKALVSYFRQSIRPAAFGGDDASLWVPHIAAFLESQITPALASAAVRRSRTLDAWLSNYVDQWVRAADAEDRSRHQPIDPASFTGLEYEQYCASILSRGGWAVRPTPATGDRGADVVADKNGLRLVVQCKLYGQPVGNKAVQEIYSARPLYSADHACVVAPRGYTAQAERDAHAPGVRLLHHSDLAEFSNEIAARAKVVPDRRSVAGRGATLTEQCSGFEHPPPDLIRVLGACPQHAKR